MGNQNRVDEVLDLVRRADGLGEYDHNLIGMAGEIIAEDCFGMEKAPRGAKGIDGYWLKDGVRRSVQVKAWSRGRLDRYGDRAMFRIKLDSTDDLLVILVEANNYQVLYSGPADAVGVIAPVNGVDFRMVQYRDLRQNDEAEKRPNQKASCYGVDGCKGGWIFACINDGGVEFGTVAELTELVDRVPSYSPIFVDIPIGLRDASGSGRRCDVEGRRLLRPHRTSSIFNAPIRAILDEPQYEIANETSKRLSGKGLSKQTFAIIPKIREVDQLMASSAKARELIREVHPEVCFYGLAGGHPMEHSKKTKEGFQARLDLLSQYQPGVEKAVEQALSHYPRKIVAADDILDALVCAITAQMSEHWKTVPVGPEMDAKGLAMEMVYCDM